MSLTGIVHAGTLFLCQKFGYEYQKKGDMIHHTKESHKNELHYEMSDSTYNTAIPPRPPTTMCTLCDKQFHTQHRLKRHNRSHSGEKLFTCNTCDQSFTTAWGLTKHQRHHSGEKPFNCTQCEKSFTRADHLKTHFIFHSGRLPEPIT